jgi:ATP-dependent helicase Lhr and Lhr-like helicase
MTSWSASASEAHTGGQSNSFGRLHPSVQRWVYDQGWQTLRKIQEEAIAVVLDNDSDLVIAASTATGKTEAVFLPLCSLIAEAPGAGIRVLAVSPLRALINDQARRLESLAKAIGTQVTPWHGDIGASVKRRLRERPAGILMITPESLEALFVLHGTRLRHLFGSLEHVVVDELHAFIGSERGRQLQSLLHRLELVLRRRIPRLALSATLGDVELAADFLRPGNGQSVRRIVSDRDGRELRLQIRGYLRGDEAEEADGLPAIADQLFRTLRGEDHLVFANRRTEVELLTDLLRRRCEEERMPIEFMPHHGSLSRDLREDVEQMLKDAARPTTAICTSTLELGIDIGSVVSIGQVGTPHSVAALRQRLGRSGRRPEDPSILRIHVREPAISATSPLQDRLRPQLVQSIAVVALLVEAWCEPPTAQALHLSTLVQQVLSLIAQYGGVRADEAWRALCKRGPFGGVEASVFAGLLRDLAAHDLVQQAGDGTLILGVAGERLVDHYTFYVAFSTPAEYRLVADGEVLGSLPVTFPLAVDSHVIFGGHRWRVVDVEENGKTVYVEPAAGGRAPVFIGAGGFVHDAVRKRMRSVYLSTEVPPYLDQTARILLHEGRAAFHACGLADRSMVVAGDEILVFLWAGDRALATVLLQLRARRMTASHDGLAIAVRGTEIADTRAVLRDLLDQPVDALALARIARDKEREKHHYFLNPDLLARDYASSILDVDAARAAVEELLRDPRRQSPDEEPYSTETK